MAPWRKVPELGDPSQNGAAHSDVEARIIDLVGEISVLQARLDLVEAAVRDGYPKLRRGAVVTPGEEPPAEKPRKRKPVSPIKRELIAVKKLVTDLDRRRLTGAGGEKKPKPDAEEPKATPEQKAERLAAKEEAEVQRRAKDKRRVMKEKAAAEKSTPGAEK